MPETAVTQAPRLVELIAWLSQRDSGQPILFGQAAKHLGVSEETVRADLDALVDLSDEHKDWLASLRVAIVADGFVVQSLGAFRRPIHLTGEEGLALLMGLGAVRGGQVVAKKLAISLKGVPPAERTETAYAVGAAPTSELESILAVARGARDERRKLMIRYCGTAGEPSERVVHVHQIIESAGRWYLNAWCEKVTEFRHFRADRVLEARLLAPEFRPQLLFQPIRRVEELLQAEERVPAKVAFSRKIARWLEEKYPSGRKDANGRYVVTFQVADPAWFVREVLQYGAEAEVLEPEGLREAVKAAVQFDEDP